MKAEIEGRSRGEERREIEGEIRGRWRERGAARGAAAHDFVHVGLPGVRCLLSDLVEEVEGDLVAQVE